MKNHTADSKIRFAQKIDFRAWELKLFFLQYQIPTAWGLRLANENYNCFFSPETSANQSRNSRSVPAINNHNQIWNHINKRPRHSNHIHIVKVKFNIRGRGSLKKLKKEISLKCLHIIFDH